VTASILVVEDDRAMAEMLVEQLEAEGRSAIFATRVSEAIALLAVQDFAVVLSDIQLPAGRDGFDLLRSLRQAEKQTPVILMTAFATPETARQAAEAGAFEFLEKPFTMERLLVAVNRAVGK
jgi:DNA-binding NtrC family response regulator